MTSSLSTRQGLLTRAGNRLSSILKEEARLFDVRLDSVNPLDVKELHRKVRTTRATLLLETTKVEEELAKYSSTVDDLPDDVSSRAEILQRTEEHINAALGVLDRAHIAMAKLVGLQQEMEEPSSQLNTTTDVAEMKLAPIPLPKFTGNIWEWDTFWRSFDYNVHSKQVDEIYKFTYLLQCLEGEAKEAVKQFQVSDSTYAIVINHLHEKYGNVQAPVDQLLRKLETSRAKSDRLEDQLALCEQLSSITAQLELKGEHINNTFFQKQLLSKFSARVQRHVLRQKNKKESEGMWNTKMLLAEAKELITDELKIVGQIEQRHRNYPDKRPDRQGATFRKEQSRQTTRLSAPCFYCNKVGHLAKSCTEVTALNQRLQIMKAKKLCQNCGGKDHLAAQCHRGACQLCGTTGHHTSICAKLFPKETTQQAKPTKKMPARATRKPSTTAKMNSVETEQQDEEVGETDTVLHVNDQGDVLLLAGQAQVLNPNTEKLETVHVMLDTGADRSFVSNALADRLQLQDVDSKRLSIRTFGSHTPTVKTCGITVLKIWDAKGQPHSFTVTRIDTVTESMRRSSLSQEDKRFLCDNNLQLSISPTSTRIHPQILLGCADLFSLLKNGLAPQYELPSGLQLIPSELGFLVTGRNTKNSEIKEDQATVNSADTETCDENLQSWEDFCTFEANGVDEFVGPTAQERQRADEAVWKMFEQTIEKRDDGYWVRFPWRKDADQLPDNKGLAVRRLQTLLGRLNAEPEVLRKYQDTLQDQLRQGIIEEVNEAETPDGDVVHYLPHRAVITPQKTTTKLRIVFDASAHLKDAPSLNEVLHRGPVLLPKLCDILLRFRIGNVAITSDVEKASLQVRIHEKDRDATRFLWIKDASLPVNQSNIIVYRFRRVTFGLICSPFLLAGTIKYHLQHFAKNKEIAGEIDNNTYVDNVVMTAESADKAITLYKESKEMFREMNMNLREFISNDDNVKQQIDRKDLSDDPHQKILGVLWNSEDDKLSLTCMYAPKMSTTKRSVSEQVASVYDPLGWLTPITLPGKRFLQQLWKCDYTWDEPLNREHQEQWKEIIQTVDGFRCQINRKVAQLHEPTKLVVFSDASSNGMAACAYITTTSDSFLVAGKSKLPSIKERPTIPKLELNALTMAVRLAHSVYEAIKDRLTVHNVIILSDSEIALRWIVSRPGDQSMGVLVRNRVREIRRLVDCIPTTVRFGYVNTAENPADCATRGMTKAELEGHFWWKGPSYITQPVESWPETELFPLPRDSQTEDTSVLYGGTSETVDELVDWKRQSNLPRCQTTVAYVLRFVKKLLSRVSPSLKKRVEDSLPELQASETRPYVTAQERERALRVLVRNHQKVHLPSERQNALKQLKLLEDEYGILRCRGRLGNSNLAFNTKFPCLIVGKTDFARLIVENAHSPLHCGTAHTMANVRQRFWVTKLRQLARSVITRCVPCQKMNNLPYRYPDMNDLPTRRVQRTRPFEHIGIDYFGPLSTKRNGEVAKVYGVILTCATTRLVHLELVLDMSTKHLLLALRRFFARRGVPASITSDNATNFVLGEEVLSRAVFPVTSSSSFAQSMAEKGIVWKTNTPYAPWQGALYERLIKTVKHSLYKVMQRTVPEQENLETLLVEVEGCVNSRPLTYQEENWDDTPILRPIDFIQKDMIITYPFETVGDEGMDESYHPPEEAAVLKTRRQTEEALRVSHRMTERFWTVWSQQYLTALRDSHKLRMENKASTSKMPEVGRVVLIAEPILPRNCWKIARITKVNRSKDGAVRDAELRLPNGRTVRRPVNLLVPLEIGDTQEPNTSENSATADNMHNRGNVDKEKGSEPRYNLRRRKTKSPSLVNSIRTTVMFCVAIIAQLGTAGARHQMNSSDTTAKGTMRCIVGGLQLTTHNIQRYELCAEEFCQVKNNPNRNETILLPPEITLHPYHVVWKFFDGNQLAIFETTCQSTSFCENVRCWFCTANVLNPECSPRTAILATAVILCITIATVYLICYVPVVIGKPLRIFTSIVWYGLRVIARILWAICCRIRRRRYQQRVENLLKAPLIAASIAAALLVVHGCHNIDVFPQLTTICSFSKSGAKECSYETTEIIKLNSFERTACIHLLNNGSFVKELRFQWKRLKLTCRKEAVIFTRSTVQRVVDSKRCAEAGSCVNEKCASINPTSKIPELDQGNGFPGITRCVESCGGPGCGCFYLSSGCLFYRIYNVPTDHKVYEIFQCRRWDELFEVEVTSTVERGSSFKTKVIGLRPSIPLQIEGMRITLNTVTMPPTPELTSTFIGDGSQFALWRQRETPNFVCDSKEAAQRLNCSVNSNCLCEPAENTVNCVCNDLNITGIFETEVENRLPARRPWVTFAASEHDPTTITATMPSFLTAELLVHMRDKFDKTVVKRIDSVSKVENAMVQGCYNCPQGATASISCTTNGEETIATIRCEDQFFTVPCRRQGAPSTLVFSSTTARIRRTCKVTCGSTSTTFELAGILQWVRTIHGTASRLIKGESTLYDEWVFPDFFHIIDVMVSWYKTIILVVLGMVTALVLSYILFWTYGLRTLLAILHALLNIVIGVARLAAWISKGVLLTMLRACAQKRASKKLL